MLFAQVREDPAIELDALKLVKSQNPDILCVTSGGCTVLSLLTVDNKKLNIMAIDMNTSQNYLCELKLAVVKYYGRLEAILDFYQGSLSSEKYLDVFDNLCLSDDCRNYWKNNFDIILFGINRSGKFEQLFRDLIKSNFDYDKTFERQNLIKIFGEAAVQNSKQKEFTEHFKNVITNYQNNYRPDNNYFYHQILYDRYCKSDLPHYLKSCNLTRVMNSAHDLEYVTCEFYQHLKNTADSAYDMVQCSNITDWFSGMELSRFIKELHRVVKKDGVIIMRRLNGDYILKNIVSGYFELSVNEFVDKSLFYSEIVVAIKK